MKEKVNLLGFDVDGLVDTHRQVRNHSRETKIGSVLARYQGAVLAQLTQSRGDCNGDMQVLPTAVDR